MDWVDVTGQPYDEEHFLEDLTWRHPVLGNALARHGFTLQKLRELAPADIPNREMTRVVFTTPAGLVGIASAPAGTMSGGEYGGQPGMICSTSRISPTGGYCNSSTTSAGMV